MLYQSYVPSKNGSLIVACTGPHQIKTLTSCTNLSDGQLFFPLTATLHQPAHNKGTCLKNAPLDIEAEMLESLQTQATFVKRFQHKPSGRAGGLYVILLQFLSILSLNFLLKLGLIDYLNFKTSSIFWNTCGAFSAVILIMWQTTTWLVDIFFTEFHACVNFLSNVQFLCTTSQSFN